MLAFLTTDAGARQAEVRRFGIRTEQPAGEGSRKIPVLGVVMLIVGLQTDGLHEH